MSEHDDEALRAAAASRPWDYSLWIGAAWVDEPQDWDVKPIRGIVMEPDEVVEPEA